MTLQEIKQISIREYLSQRGVKPEKENERRGMYHSPLREDKNASFSVDYVQNVWFDHGPGEGGSIIDLVSKLENCTIGEAIKKLEEGSFSFHRIEDHPRQEPLIQITQVKELSNPALLAYLRERGVSREPAEANCSEVHYVVNGKPYFAIGFQNDAGGYELRNKYFKGCTSKEITSIQQGKDTCHIFEGFMDYLSFLTLRYKNSPLCPNTDKQDYFILNSISNLPKVLDKLGAYEYISCFLDNDEAGYRACQRIQQMYGSRVSDQSKH